MKNIKYLLLIMVATFMSVTSVNADSIGITVNKFETFENEDTTSPSYTTSNTQWKIFDGIGFRAVQYTGASSHINWHINSSAVKGNIYNMSFTILQPNIGTSSDTFNGGVPIVLASDSYCTVAYSSSVTTNPENPSSSYINLYSVFCPSVDIVLDNLVIGIITPTGTYQNGSYTSWYALSSSIDFTRVNSNGEVIGALEDNTDATNDVKDSVDDLNESQKETNEKLNELNENITSTDAPNLGALDNSAGWLPPGPIDSILNLPLSLFNSLLIALASTCQPLNLTFPFVDFNYQLPCVSSLYAKIRGANAVIDFVGLVIGVLILYYYFIHLYNWVDDRLTMKQNDDWGGV